MHLLILQQRLGAVPAVADLGGIQPFQCEPPQGIGEREAARVDQLTAEAELIDRIMFAGYAGPDWERLREALAGYGLVVCSAWIGTGQIFTECAKKGIAGLSRDPRLPGDAEDVAADTVIAALTYFREHVLIPRVWNPELGASLKTFFVGACVLHFRNVYRGWRRQQNRFGVFQDADITRAGDARPSSRPDRAAAVALLLHDVKDPLIRQIGVYIAQGYTQGEVADLLNLELDNVRSRLERYRGRHHG
jgi:DNA-directed RNA polymerase specialized sigma24 family protein